MIRLIPYFWCTHLHTSSFLFVVSFIQLNVVGNSEVISVVCFDLIQFTQYFTHSIVLMHSPSQCNLVQSSIARNSEVSAFLTELNFHMIQIILWFQCTHLHTLSLLFIVISVESKNVGNSKVSAFFLFLPNTISVWFN